MIRHGYSEQEIETAILYRKPAAARAFYISIEQRLQEGLGWPDKMYNESLTNTPLSIIDGVTGESSSDVMALDKLDRHEPILPARRKSPRQSSSLTNKTNKISPEKSNYVFDELVVRGNVGASSITRGLTQEALNELGPQLRLTARKSSVIGSSHVGPTEIHVSSRRTTNSNSLAPIKSSLSPQRENILIVQSQQQPTFKPRSVPNSTLDHVNQNTFHLSNDPNGSRASKAPSRMSHIEHTKKSQEHSPVRYKPGK